MPELSGISHIDLTVTDRDRNERVYTEVPHLSFRVATRAELERWQEHFDRHGVPYTLIVDAPYGSVVVFRDPDNIQLELMSDPES